MIYTGSKALQYMSIPLFTIFKNLTIILIAVGERRFFNGSPITPPIALSFVLMVLSSIIAGWSDIMAGKIFKEGTEDVSPLVSYGWMAANCLTSAFYALIMRSKIKQVSFKDFDTVYYSNLISIPILLAFSYLVELSEFYTLQETYFGIKNNKKTDYEYRGLVWSIILSGVSGFAISFGSSWCVRVTSSTTYRYFTKLP
jgi:GDP-mannose transporter